VAHLRRSEVRCRRRNVSRRDGKPSGQRLRKTASRAGSLRLAPDPRKGEDEIVVDKKKWKEWVKANEQAIRTHAKPGFDNSLYNKVLSVYRLASGKVVPNAFNSLCLPLTEEMTAELAGRDLVVHRGLMAPDGYDVDRDLRRVAIVRTMLVALVALVCGYRGAILGWEHDYFGTAFAPEHWWKIDPEERERAQQKYLTLHNEDDEVPSATEVPGSPESEPAS
jgi:hypothetical protein